MLLDRVIIGNFKSYGIDNNVLDVNPKITTIIGKNGSGKSNIIEFFKYFNVRETVSSVNISKFKNLNILNQPQEFRFDFVFDKKEQDLLGNNERTTFTLNNDGTWHFAGGLQKVISEDEILSECKEKLCIMFNQPIFKTDVKDRIKILEKSIETFSSKEVDNNIKLLRSALQYLKDTTNLQMFSELIDKFSIRIDYFCNLVPNVFCFNNKLELKDFYSLNEIIRIQQSKISEDNEFLSLILKVLNIDINELIYALTPSNPSTAKKKKEIEINEILESETSNIFEQIHLNNLKLSFACKDNLVEMYVYNNNTPILLTERSNGLKWYLSLYLQMKAQNHKNRTIILIDEPGQSIHIEAQKSLLQLFEKIAESSQIIYTAHSPFMIDTEDLTKLVITEKVAGISKIHNKIHSANLEKSSKLETLSPFYQALGYSCQYNIGPKFDKLNIITEGISDYYYLLGFMYYADIEKDKFVNIIPSAGVDNIHNIASVLIGWNCPFKVLVDYDNGGFRELKNLKKLSLEEQKVIFTVTGASFSKHKPDLCESRTIENILVEPKYQNVEDGDKLLFAKEFYDEAKSKNLILSSESKKNILNLLTSLGIHTEN